MGRYRLSVASALVLGLLAGCVGETPRGEFGSGGEHPLREVTIGMTGEQVGQRLGPPLDVSPRPGETGLCLDYRLSTRQAETAYYVSFDGDNRVDGKGFSTCREQARKRPKGRY